MIVPTTSKERKDLLALIQRTLRDYGLSASDLARRSGISGGTVSRILSGESEGKSESLESLVRAARELIADATRYRAPTTEELLALNHLDYILGRYEQGPIVPPNLFAGFQGSVHTHPLVMFATGHRLFFISIRYPAGFANGRAQVENLLMGHLNANPRGTSLYDLFGEWDLLVRIWIDPASLRLLLDSMLAQGISDIRALPVNWIFTPIQRAVESGLESPMTLGMALAREGDTWTVSRGLVEPVHRESQPGYIRFFVIFKCAREDEATLFESVRDGCQNALRVLERTDEPGLFENYSVYSYSLGTEAGCILTGDTENWQAMQPAFFRLLQSAGVAERKTTTLIRAGQNDIEDERPSFRSLKREDVHDIPGLRLQLIEMSLGLGEIAKGTALNDRFKMLFLREEVAESIAMYDPRYWWRFLHELRYLFENLAQHRNGRVLAFFMLAYTRIEAELRKLLLAHFRLPVDREHELKPKFERLVLDKCGVLEMEAPRRSAARLLRQLHREEPRDLGIKETFEATKYNLGNCINTMEEQLKKDSYIILGSVYRVVTKVREFGGFMDGIWRLFSEPRMKNWDKQLESIANDRNKLMHGVILDVYQAPSHGAAHWELLTSNYIRAYPRVQWIINALCKNLAELPQDQRVLVGATESSV